MKHALVMFEVKRKDGKDMSREEVRRWVQALRAFLEQNGQEHMLRKVDVSDPNGNNL